jgi:hypothetical protein
MANAPAPTNGHRIPDPVSFFKSLADLHDARIEGMSWSSGRLLIVIDDLYSGFLDLPEYCGPRRATLEFDSPRQLSLTAVDASRLSILGLEVKQLEAGGFTVAIDLSPDGRIQTTCETIRGDFEATVVEKSVKAANCT